MQAGTYQGWANYPTWAVHLHITNDEGTYEHALDLVDEWLADGDEPLRLDLDERLREWVDEWTDPGAEDSLLLGDLLGWAFDHIDWREITNALCVMHSEVRRGVIVEDEDQ